MKRIGRILAGISLCVAGLAGAFYSSKALRAQIVYHHVRYGSLKAAPAQDIKIDVRNPMRFIHTTTICVPALPGPLLMMPGRHKSGLSGDLPQIIIILSFVTRRRSCCRTSIRVRQSCIGRTIWTGSFGAPPILA